ncbi:MAG: hypothetical protein WA058_04075 [Minisyncoccia bacterium]
MNDTAPLVQSISEFDTFDIESLKRVDLGAAFSFEEVFPELKATFDLLKGLSGQKDELGKDLLIPQTLINALTGQLNSFNGIAKQIRDFDVRNGGDPNPRRDSIKNQIISLRREAVNQLHPLQVILQLKQLDPSAYAKSVQTTRADIEKVLEQIIEKDKEAAKALQGIKNLSATSGVTTYSQVFGGQAEVHQRLARWWLGAAVGFFVVLGFYLGYLLSVGIPVSNDLPETIREVSLRVLVLIAIYFAMSQSIKNFSVNKHLQVVNEHRQNTMRIFEVFLNSATTDSAKEHVLLEATKSVFDANKTGYLHKEGQNNLSFSVGDFFKSTGNS